MKIIIIGAGRVGSAVAENLISKANDITVIDLNQQLLDNLQSNLDLSVIQGHGAHPSVLELAGAKNADLLVAVSSSDEVNMLACQIAHSLFQVTTKVARIRSPEYSKLTDSLFHPDHIPVDHFIAPEQEVTSYIQGLIQYPGALQVLEFAEGKVSLVSIKAHLGSQLLNYSIAELKELLHQVEIQVAAIYRADQAIKPTPETVIQLEDEVFFVAATPHIKLVMQAIQPPQKKYRNIMIAGGGLVGARLAHTLQNKHRVKLIEKNSTRAEFLSAQLKQTIVLNGDASDPRLLHEERIESIDVYIAVADEDETNIMSAMLAKRMGAKKTMVLIQRSAYIDLVQGREIDIAISPQQTTVSAVLKHIRKDFFINDYSLRKGAAEAIELLVLGDEQSSKVIGKEIRELPLPPGTTIGAIVRGSEVLIAQPTSLLEHEDRVILFLLDKAYLDSISKLFTPGALSF